MKNYVIILAGGSGQRMGEAIPKQFLPLNNKPVIVHTIENFQLYPSIEAVLIVCINDWIPQLKQMVVEYNLSKVQWIIPGGETVHDSTRNGVFFLKDKINTEDFVIIHDAARPILPQKAIDVMLSVAHNKGNACLAIPCYETVLYTDDQLAGTKQLDRNKIMRIQTPQAYCYKMLCSLYERAEEEDLHNFVYADLVAIYYGKTVFFSKGFVNNIKITRKEDITLCRSLMTFTDDELFNI